MLHVDIPSSQLFKLLNNTRADACVSIYLKTTPVTGNIAPDRIEFGNLVTQAKEQLENAKFEKRRLAALLEYFDDLIDDDDFWQDQANSLAVLATPDGIRTFRLANSITPMVQVSDRFHLKPLWRATTFPQTAFVLALSENGVRLVEVFSEMPPVTLKVDGLPKNAASAVGKSTLNDRAPSGRIQGAEGQNVRFRQYARQVDAAIRAVLTGSGTPLILAATGRLASVFRSVNSYPNLLPSGIDDSPDRISDAELANLARPVLDANYKDEIEAIQVNFSAQTSRRRTTTDLSDAARAATFGGIETLLIDIDGVIPGTVDEITGIITLADDQDATTYGIIDEIAGRALNTGANVLAVRKSDIPENADLAAILRYQL
jgi:hypothetical protein